MGMFCRLGLDDESRPVAAPVWLKLVCKRPVARVDQRRQGVHVSALELGELPVFEHLAHDLVIGRQVFQHVGGGGDGLALSILHGRGQIQIFEQHAPQLLRRADVECLPRQRVDLGGQPRNLALHQPREPPQFLGDRCARRCAPCAPARSPAAARSSAYSFRSPRDSTAGASCCQISSVISACCSGRRAQLQIQPPPGLLVQRAARGVGIQQKGVQHHVVLEAARLRFPCGPAPAAPISRRRRSWARAASSSHGFRCGRFSAVTARASPGRHARPMVSSANSPSADFEIATATGAPAGTRPATLATPPASLNHAIIALAACPRPAPVPSAGCGTPAPCRRP